MQLSNESILVILFVGLVAGWLAGKIVRGTGFGIIGDILVGIAGALVASLLFPKLGIAIGTGLVREIIYSAIGAVILLLIVRLVRTGGSDKAESRGVLDHPLSRVTTYRCLRGRRRPGAIAAARLRFNPVPGTSARSSSAGRAFKVNPTSIDAS
jgi:uncharacterized membrane protein YeaQ/YmgE (transglycosylase-associated protein family)